MVLWRPRCPSMRLGGGINLSLSLILIHPLLSKTLYVRTSNGGRGNGREGGRERERERKADGQMDERREVRREIKVLYRGALGYSARHSSPPEIC